VTWTEDLGVLLSLPLESIAVRAVLATLIAVGLVRLALRIGLRTPSARVATSFAPALALVAVVVLTGTAIQVPVLMFPSDGGDALLIPVRDGYLHFAPLAVPIVVGAWASIAVVRLARRLRVELGARSSARAALRLGRTDVGVTAVARRLADRLGTAAPRVAVVPSCPGGAFVVGIRRPTIVIDAELVAALDEEELEGVLAHELAHVRRRDTLVSTSLGTLRDLTYFVPGGGWAISQLHRERELAADQIAATTTGRPGALASGLLKVLETAPGRTHACAPLAPSGGLVDRVTVLLDESPAPRRSRRAAEVSTVAVAVAVATTAALAVPATMAGADRERDQLALVWSATQPAPATTVDSTVDARAFEVYRRSSLDVTPPTVALSTNLGEQSQENRRAALHACAEPDGICPVASRPPGLGLRPAPVIRTDAGLSQRWEPVPVAGSDAEAGLRLFWLAQRPE
jgi:Zn-dependent protease with chaperone function